MPLEADGFVTRIAAALERRIRCVQLMRGSLAVGAMLLGTPPASAQNLLANGDFATDLAGWENGAAFIASEWSSADAQGELDSGSALVTNTSPSGGGGGNGIRRCVAIEPGATYSLSGCVFIPFGQASTGHGTLQPQFFSELGCTGSVVGVGGTDFVTAVNTWDCRENPAVMAPFEARSARIIAFVSKTQAGGSLSMRFDDVALVPEPGAAEVAALAVLAACGRRGQRGRRAGVSHASA